MTLEEYIKDNFHYNPETGDLWRKCKNYYRLCDTINKTSENYFRVQVLKKRYFVHRICWFLYYCIWPDDQIDHVNGITNDNRIDNLREATASQNQMNAKLSSNNTSGYKGVVYIHDRQKWRAQITLNNKMIYIGIFSTKEAAFEAYKNKAQQLFGEFNYFDNR